MNLHYQDYLTVSVIFSHTSGLALGTEALVSYPSISRFSSEQKYLSNTGKTAMKLSG